VRSASAASSNSLTELEERLGHAFADKGLLRRALTHASADTDASNERLEFLGDRVLGLIAAEQLHERYPDDAEGGLALKFNALARRETCAAAAEAAGLAQHIILAKAEAGSGGRRKTPILAGACEAIIAALYLDGGMAAARQFVDRYWANAFAALGSDMRDPKTVLQEWAQSRSGNNDAAVTEYREALAIDPDFYPATGNLGLMHLKQNAGEEAAVELFPF